MKRYYVCPVVEHEVEPGLIGYRLAIQDYPDTPFEGGEIPLDMDPSSPTYGKPLHKFGLVLVNSRYHGKFINNPKMYPLPMVDLDIKVSSIHTATKNKMIADLQSLGVDTSFIGNADGYRDVIRGIGRIINPNFNENDFDVEE